MPEARTVGTTAERVAPYHERRQLLYRADRVRTCEIRLAADKTFRSTFIFQYILSPTLYIFRIQNYLFLNQNRMFISRRCFGCRRCKDTTFFDTDEKNVTARFNLVKVSGIFWKYRAVCVFYMHRRLYPKSFS